MSSVQTHLNYLAMITPGPERDPASYLAAIKHLDPFLRALLVADGTVTLLLQAYFGERIQVEAVDQAEIVVDVAIPQLGLQAGGNAFFRQVELTGKDSGHRYAFANSVLNPTALTPELFQALIKKNVGMGEVLRNSARGSYREILDIRAGEQGKMERTYAVLLEAKPAILITEVFDTVWFEPSNQ